jgi:hypothetical protein
MNRKFRFALEAGSKKHFCPQCEKRRLVRYIDTETGNYLPTHYGRCDRESACQYHLNPYSDGYAKAIEQEEKGLRSDWKPLFRQPVRREAPTSPPVHFDRVAFSETLVAHNYKRNSFIQNLAHRGPYPFTEEQLTRAIELYLLGTVPDGEFAGALTIPFIDDRGNIRAVQVKQFDQTNHTMQTTFLHSILAHQFNEQRISQPEWLTKYQAQEKRITCLFGAHLLNQYPVNPIALVEAPKTAIYGALYFGFPDQPKNLLWLAVYNKSSFTLDKMRALKGRTVFVFPDLSKDGSTFREWKEKADAIQRQLPGTRFVFSDLLERYANEQQRENGADLADILIQHNWKEYHKNWRNVESVENAEQKQTIPTSAEVQPITETSPVPIKEQQPPRARTSERKQPARTQETKSREDWLDVIRALEEGFASSLIPETPLRINPCATLSNARAFIEANLQIVKANNGNKRYSPYLERLINLHDLLNPGAGIDKKTA